MACTTVCTPINVVISHAEIGYKPACNDNMSSDIDQFLSPAKIGSVITAEHVEVMNSLFTLVTADRGYGTYYRPDGIMGLVKPPIFNGLSLSNPSVGQVIDSTYPGEIIGTISGLSYFSGYFGTNFQPGEVITAERIRKLGTFLKSFANACHCVNDIQKTDDGDQCVCNY